MFDIAIKFLDLFKELAFAGNWWYFLDIESSVEDFLIVILFNESDSMNSCFEDNLKWSRMIFFFNIFELEFREYIFDILFSGIEITLDKIQSDTFDIFINTVDLLSEFFYVGKWKDFFYMESLVENFFIVIIFNEFDSITFVFEDNIEWSLFVILYFDDLEFRECSFNILFSGVEIALDKIQSDMLDICIKTFYLLNEFVFSRICGLIHIFFFNE